MGILLCYRKASRARSFVLFGKSSSLWDRQNRFDFHWLGAFVTGLDPCRVKHFCVLITNKHAWLCANMEIYCLRPQPLLPLGSSSGSFSGLSSKYYLVPHPRKESCPSSCGWRIRIGQRRSPSTSKTRVKTFRLDPINQCRYRRFLFVSSLANKISFFHEPKIEGQVHSKSTLVMRMNRTLRIT